MISMIAVFTSPFPFLLQRVYQEAFLNASDWLPAKPFVSLIKGGAFVASNCRNANANRDEVIAQIRKAGFRADGLAKCMTTPDNKEGVWLPKDRNTEYDLGIKRNVISHYMFSFAFENAIEPGYVTEKPFDALIAGVADILVVSCIYHIYYIIIIIVVIFTCHDYNVFYF